MFTALLATREIASKKITIKPAKIHYGALVLVPGLVPAGSPGASLTADCFLPASKRRKLEERITRTCGAGLLLSGQGGEPADWLRDRTASGRQLAADASGRGR